MTIVVREERIGTELEANDDLAIQFGIQSANVSELCCEAAVFGSALKRVGGRRVNVVQRAISTAKATIDSASAIVAVSYAVYAVVDEPSSRHSKVAHCLALQRYSN